MDKIQGKRVYSLWIATSIKFYKITPKEIIDALIEYCEEEDDIPLPVSIQPFEESIKLCKNIFVLTSHMEMLRDEHNELFTELTEEFDQMNTETFISWYKNQAKS